MTQIKNLTPADMRCMGGACPSLLQLEDGRLLVVGEMPGTGFRASEAQDGIRAEYKGCEFNLGNNEAAIIIDPALLDVYVAEKVREERERCAKIAYQFAEEADHGGKETPAGRDARKIGNAIRFGSPVSEG